MISLDLKKLFGFDYNFLDDEKTIAAIHTPFFFEDGDSVPVYIEEVDGRLRFCDCGGVIWQLMARGVWLDEPGQDKFIEELARPTGVTLNGDDELEIWIDPGNVNASFTRFMCAMLAMVRWDYEYVAAQRRRRPDEATEPTRQERINA
ncbi:MAG: DUF1828 domain-containing protein [Telluria sp.]